VLETIQIRSYLMFDTRTVLAVATTFIFIQC